MSPVPDSDLLSGCASIAEFLHLTERQVRHLSEIGAIPTFKLPGSVIVRARRSSLQRWLADQEAAALAAKHQPSED